ncbi:ATP-binding protein [Mesorhizobium sp. YM1C-6-2]|uniref:sensor histidine kinase n=1 Tax=Mesorhizobium sp. YM1C-6-2 TaxID=1827501 RepID=UPI0011C39295|nr:ATP-binding protein [Mesorhizobium sp. YM1C-6-2]
MLATAALAGMIMSGIVTKATVEHTAARTALFMDSFLSPHAGSLAENDTLALEAAASLDRLLGSEDFKKRFPHLEIWKPDGFVAYSTSSELIGQKFAPPAGLKAALQGTISAQYTDLEAQEHVARHINKKFLEIYVPVREDHSGRIIAVAEIHELPGPLEEKLIQIRLQTWFATAGLTLLVMMSLYGIVYRGSRTIAEQQERLRENLEEVREFSEQNRILRERSQRASSRVAELNAKYLRNVGAELHDGPAQLVGLANLKVEHIRRARTDAKRNEELDFMDAVLTETLRDIRTISKGLMLPEIEEIPLCEVIDLVARTHEKRTGTQVELDCTLRGEPFAHSVKICVYRFVQEGLNNAFKHAGGIGQSVSCRLERSLLTVSVRDGGGGRTPTMAEFGLGLTGMRDRVESLGGTVNIRQNKAGGTVVEMCLEIDRGSVK